MGVTVPHFFDRRLDLVNPQNVGIYLKEVVRVLTGHSPHFRSPKRAAAEIQDTENPHRLALTTSSRFR